MNFSLFGAQKYYPVPNAGAAICFGVYAPNALRVEVVFGLIWTQEGNKQIHVDKNHPVPFSKIAGGYIADDGTGIDSSLPIISLIRDENGCWFSDPKEPELQNFQRWDHVPYMFRITKNDGSVAYRTDLYSRCQIGAGQLNPNGLPYNGLITELSGTKSCSVVVDPDTVTKFFNETDNDNVPIFPETNFITQEEFWKDELNTERALPKHISELIIYQLHIPALGFGRNGIGKIDDAIQLLDYLVELGVNAVELLPVAEYGDNPETWGYSTTHHFAIEFSGGGRDKMKQFIKAAHQRGIAVIFDVVYNHFAADAERAEWFYDTNDHEKNIYYWYHGNPFDYDESLKGAGGYLDNMSTGFAPRYSDPFVRNLFISSAIMLLEEFHVDGFRVDQTTSIHSYNQLHADGRSMNDANICGGDFLREWSRRVREVKPNVFLMAEDHSGWDAVTCPVEENGLGFDAVWYADFHHHLNGANFGDNYAKLIPTAGYGGDNPLAMTTFGLPLMATNHRKIVYHISHDEAGNAGRNNSDPDQRSHRTMILAVRNHLDKQSRPYAEARSRVAFALSLFSAGIPMFLFGEEVAFLNDFLYDDVLSKREDIYAQKNGDGRSMFEFYSAAIKLRRNCSAFCSEKIELLHIHDDNRIIVFRRWNESEDYIVVASLNNHFFERGYIIEHPSIVAGQWRKILNSNSEYYEGTDHQNENLQSTNGHIELDIIPANSVIVLEKISYDLL
jgi:1,4-alpha-glucan branching enzyme